MSDGGGMYHRRERVAPRAAGHNNPTLMLRDAVIRAAARAEVRHEVLRVYADLQNEIDLRRPACNASGRCCRFEQFGHRLYVTTMELAAFAADAPTLERDWDGTGCPYQADGLCGVHSIRPFGCRVFFCDASSDEWQHRQYERLHGELKRAHERLGVEYFYVEWRQGLRELGVLSVREVASGGAGTGGREGGKNKALSLPQLPF
jgi:Fe-S-cluster containining protein